MQRLGFYLFRQLLTAFLFMGAAVTFVVLFTQSFRILSLIIDNSSTFLVFLQLMGLTIPTFLPLVLPLGVGAAIIFVYHKLAVDSELVVMRAAGVGPLRLAAPGLLLAVLVMLCAYAFTLWATPAAFRSLVALQYEVRDNFAAFLARPGSFNDVTDGLTFYAERRGAGGTLEGILIHDVRKPDRPVTVMADAGKMIEKDGEPQIVVFNGRRQELDTATGHLSQLAFDQYVLELAALRTTGGKRLADPREQTIEELLNPSEEMVKLRASTERLRGEVHQRLASPLLALSFAFTGLAAILIGAFNRRGMGQRLVIASVVIITGQALFMSLNSLVARHAELAPLLYVVAIAPALAGFLLLSADVWRRYVSVLPAGEEPVAP